MCTIPQLLTLGVLPADRLARVVGAIIPEVLEAGAVAAAKHYIGTPYAWGGADINGPSAGTYSSTGGGRRLLGPGPVRGIQRHRHPAGALGREARQGGLAGQCRPRDWSKMRAGDVISFSEDGSSAAGSFGHVGIYLGNGQMIHAPRRSEAPANL